MNFDDFDTQVQCDELLAFEDLTPEELAEYDAWLDEVAFAS